MQRQALARLLIDDSQDTDPATIRQTPGNEIHTPFFVPAQGLALRQALTLCSFFTLPRSHLQSLLGIQTIDPLRVHFSTLALQQDRQAPVAVPHSAAGQLPQTHPQCLMTFR